MSNLPRVLFVPQTKRNFAMLRLFSNALISSCEVIYLRNCIFDENSDIGIEARNEDIQLEEPDFLVQPLQGNHRQLQVCFHQWRLHKIFRAYLQKLKLNLVVVGIDGTGMGHWAASVCRSMGIPTIVCQEGIPWTFELHDPYSIKFKRFLFNVFSTIIYPHARCFDDYKTAEYVAVWGKHTKDNCIAHGLSPQKIMIVGDPRIKPRAAFSPKKKSDIFQLLFLDIPVTTLSKGVFNSTAHTALRKELIHLIITQNYHLIYKPHPFTQSAELESIYELTSNLPQVELITSGVAEDLYARSDAGLTFPSTCVCSILAFGLPLIQIHSDYAGFTKLLWDPASEHQAGFTIKQIQEIPDAVRQIQQTEWRSQYWEASRIAAEEVVGPLDGNAPERFAEVVRNILKVPKIV